MISAYKNKAMKSLGMALLLLAGMMTSCSDDNTSDLQVKGDCAVTAFAANDFDGIINAENQTITVRVPETYDVSLMNITRLDITPGATANLHQGDNINLNAPQALRVTNGNVFLNWTISARRDEARILSFTLAGNGSYNTVIDQDTKTITAYIPQNEDITSLIPTIVLSEDATVLPMSGVATDFTNPVTYQVTNNTASATYTVKVTQIDKPQALFLGMVPSMADLNKEELAACNWMLANIPNSIYASMADIQNGNVDLSECKVMWWHFHKDGGVDGKERFMDAAPAALNAAVKLKDFYNAGGSFFFTRYATNMPAFIGAIKNEGCPNNCWGGAEETPEVVGGPWSFFIDGNNAHPLWQNLVMNDGEPDLVYTFDTGYGATNSTAQWHIGADWGGYADKATWANETGAKELAHGGDGAVVAWEIPATGTNGRILCIGSGCYDWYTPDPKDGDRYHGNVAKITENAFNYLMNK